MVSKQGASRSLVSVAVELFAKADKAQEKANAANTDLKRWVRQLNAVETEEYAALTEAYRREHDAE